MSRKHASPQIGNYFKPISTVKDIDIELSNGNVYGVDYPSQAKIDFYKARLDFIEEDKVIRFQMPAENAAYKVVAKTAALCAFNATDDYMQSKCLGRLSTADKNWYHAHPKTSIGGLDESYTLTVISDLIKPYDLGIASVYYRKLATRVAETKAWQAALGVNPMANIDCNTSNEEYIKMMPEGYARELAVQQSKDWNFQYSATIPKPIIMCSMLATATSFALTGGHAVYASPRERVDNWKVAFTIDKLSNIKYHAEVPTVEDTETTMYNLDLDNCKGKSGQKLGNPFTYTNPAYSGNYNIGGYNNGSKTAKPDYSIVDKSFPAAPSLKEQLKLPPAKEVTEADVKESVQYIADNINSNIDFLTLGFEFGYDEQDFMKDYKDVLQEAKIIAAQVGYPLGYLIKDIRTVLEGVHLPTKHYHLLSQMYYALSTI